jgi:uncharacterized protein YkwD
VPPDYVGVRIATRAAATTLGLALAVALAVAGALPAQGQGYVSSDETKVHNMVNSTRTKKGLAPLARRDELVKMARDQADRMEAKGDIFHNVDLGGTITRLGLGWLRVGENVGMGPDVDLIYGALLKSPKHYENIVRPDYNTMGIGVVDGDDGLRYVVQVFANVTGAAVAAAPKKAATPPPAAPKAPPAPPAPAYTAPAHVRAAPTAPPAAPKPTAKPKAVDPNALTGGYVSQTDLGPSDLGRYIAAPANASGSGFNRFIDILAFWS